MKTWNGKEKKAHHIRRHIGMIGGQSVWNRGPQRSVMRESECRQTNTMKVRLCEQQTLPLFILFIRLISSHLSETGVSLSRGVLCLTHLRVVKKEQRNGNKRNRKTNTTADICPIKSISHYMGMMQIPEWESRCWVSFVREQGNVSVHSKCSW